MLRERLARMGAPVAEEGMHHFPDAGSGHRVHLRVSSDGGLLLVDASRIYHLNRQACDMAWLLLSGCGREEAVSALGDRYRTRRRRLAEDLERFSELLRDVVEGAEPGDGGMIEVTPPFSASPRAPYRMDLALTYRCNVDCRHCYNQSRGSRELPTGQWTGILNRLWDASVPHVVFTGGEPTMRDDLAELVSHAESLGMVTGLLTNGVLLGSTGLARTLAGAGLDHVQVTLESRVPQVHDWMVGARVWEKTVEGVRRCLEAGIHTITNTTLTTESAESALELPEFLRSELGLEAFAVNTIIRSGRSADGGPALSTDELETVLLGLRSEAERLGLRMIWYSPTRYCRLSPLELDLGPKRCTAGEHAMCVQPDGTVLPCQSYYEVVGDMLSDDWETIWRAPLLERLRSREWLPPECSGCPDLPLCGGGCPLEAGDGALCRSQS